MPIVKIVHCEELRSGIDCPGCRFPIDLNVGEVAMLYQHGGEIYCPACKGRYGIIAWSPIRVAELRDGAVQPQHDLGRTSRLIQMVNSLGNIIIESYGKGYIAENDLNQANDYLDFVIPLLPKS